MDSNAPEAASLADREPPRRASGDAATHFRGWIAAAAIVVVAAAAAAVWYALAMRVTGSLQAAERLMAQKRWPRAERELRAYLAAHPGDSRGLMALARTLAGQEQFDACARELEKVAGDAPERAAALLRAGQAWKRSYRRRDAERVWLDCLRVPQGDFELPGIQQECRRELSEMYALERRRREFLDITWQMVESAVPPQRHDPLAMRVRYDMEMVDPPAALIDLEPTLEKDPHDTITRRAVGLYHLEAGRSDEARAQLYPCVREAPDQPIVWEAWLVCLYRTADLAGLKQAVAELPAAADESAECWKYRAIAAEQEGDVERGIAAARRAIDRAPGDAENHHRLGQLLLREGEKAEGQQELAQSQALADARQELRDHFDDYRARWAREAAEERASIAYQIGQASAKLGLLRDAAAWYRAALSESPSDAVTIQALEAVRQAEQAPAQDAPAAPQRAD